MSEAQADGLSESDVIKEFHRHYYNGFAEEQQVWMRSYWMNVPCI